VSSHIREKQAWNISGLVGVLIVFALGGLAISFWLSFVRSNDVKSLLAAVVIGFLIMVLTSGFVIVQPMEARIIQFFGHYVGVVRDTGLRLTLPWSSKQMISLRLRNFESPRLKVNDADGNPVEIGAIVVWKVLDAAQAVFNVDSLDKFIEKQTEGAVRMLATTYPYDKHDDHKLSLHGSINEINDQLKVEVNARLTEVGVTIVEVRISHLAYAPEIAAAMLQRQQAQAIIAARTKIVEGAVGMVDMALKALTKNGIVQLDEERKAAMVSNLLVVLCSERPSQPVLNTGSV
jgi:regulator of protease activity HflC (stomatin/prohibitin superfamily)